jgi:hypothetical protein
MRDDNYSGEMVPLQSTAPQPDQSRAISAAAPRALGAEDQLKDFARPLKLLGRARDLARRLEIVALIAGECGWTRPARSASKNRRFSFAAMHEEDRRAARLLRGLETLADFRREALRLAADRELEGRFRAALAPAGVDLIADAFSLMLATVPSIVATGPAYAPAAELTIADLAPSIAALTLALDDCARAEGRKFGRAPTQFEIDAALERRETDCEHWREALEWLGEYAQALPGITAEEEAAERKRQADALEEAKRQLEAAERAARKTVAEAESQRAAAEKYAAIGAEIAKLIAAGKFADAKEMNLFLFPRAANAFLANPTATPQTVEALRAFLRADEARRVRQW